MVTSDRNYPTVGRNNLISGRKGTLPVSRDQKIKFCFRDRFDELLEFAPALHKFLNEASVDHEIFVINQADKYRFNRASLINVGYIYTADKGFDYLGKRFKRLKCVGDTKNA